MSEQQFIEHIDQARQALRSMDAVVLRLLDPQSDAFMPYGEAATELGVLLDAMRDRLTSDRWWHEGGAS